MRKPSVFIFQGWAGGKWHTRDFAKALQSNGFVVSDNSSNADIIVAHSTGCYGLPTDLKARLVMLMNPPYWPDKSILERLLKKKGHDTKLAHREHGKRYVFLKTLWEGVYIVTRPRYTVLAIKHHRKLDFLEHLEDKKVVLVRNENDYFCSPGIESAVKKYPNVRYIQLPGAHDDYYTNPKPYIDLLLKEL